MVSVAWEASERLAAEGIKVGVVNARFVKPIDLDTLVRVGVASGKILTLEENVLRGGYGESVRAGLEHSGIEVHCIGLPDAFVEHGSQTIIRAEAGLSADSVIDWIRTRLSSKSRA